jgi:mannose-1-phosphate guanylyltransferase
MATANYYGLILAGGRGTRFWPRSRTRHPKQVLNVAGTRTLIQETVDRLTPVIPPDRMWILTNDFVRDEIVRQLPEVPANQIIAEPAQRNTAPAMALAAHILKSIDPKAVFGVFPSDHVVRLPKRYLKCLMPVFRAAGRGKIGVLGIKARWPDTAYGYIEFPKGTVPALKAIEVSSFHEKPDEKLAKKFFRAGNYYWNAGMFFLSAETMLHAMREHQPQTASLLASLPPFGDKRFAAKLTEVFPLCTNISVDSGVMEHAKNVVGVACHEFGWSDVGSWDAVYDLLPHDSAGNASRSELLCSDATGNYVDCGKKKLVALLGVDDLIIVDTPDALLVANRKRAQQVGGIVKLLENNGRTDLL